MRTACVLLLVAGVAMSASGMSLRSKRQLDNGDQLEDRYESWNGGNNSPQWNSWEQQERPLRPARPQRPLRPTTPPPTQDLSTQSASYTACMRNCPATPEYNPVCGSDNITYSNPGRLECARNCGLEITVTRFLPCPSTTVAPII